MSLFRLFTEAEEPITGQRTFLRAPQARDFNEWRQLRLASRAFLEKWEPTWAPDEFSSLTFRQRVRYYASRARDDQGYSFLIFARDTGRMVGGITMSHIRRGVSQSATLGYWMGEAYAGNGLMKDALTALIDAAPARFGLHRLEAACIPRNEASRRLLLSCGFAAEGFARSYVKIAGQWEDHLLFGRAVD